MSVSHAQDATPTASPTENKSPADLKKVCEQRLGKVPGSAQLKQIETICSQISQISSCATVKGEPIFHWEKAGDPKEKSSQKILVLSLIHGDEPESASVSAAWMERLSAIQPRNSWRVIPIMNPDSWDLKTRTNANGVDVNRNFPSKDWDELALKYWKEKAASNDRRFPGTAAASEPETKCAMKHIEEFKPDFIISIHTPLGVLDFDGPKVPAPKFGPLPWVALGNYPGSLGRYMWKDRSVPVLTVELKNDKNTTKSLEQFDKLQDITGTVAIQSEKLLKRDKPKAQAPSPSETK
jgi:hypothetical protein